MAFKNEGADFRSQSHFTNEMSRFVGDEVASFSNNETAAGAVDDMAEKAVRVSYEKTKSKHEDIKAHRKDIASQIKTQEKSLKEEKAEYVKAKQELQDKKDMLEAKMKSQGTSKEFKEEKAKIKEQERFLNDKASNIETKELKLNEKRAEKKDVKKKENKERKKQSAKLNVANMLKAKKGISNEVGGIGGVTGDAFEDGKSGLVGTFLQYINPFYYLKKLLAYLGSLLAPYVLIFATIAIVLVMIIALLFDALSPAIAVHDAIEKFVSNFTDDNTFVNTSLSEDKINEIIEKANCDETQEKVLRFALSKVGYPYSQDYRTSGNYYDCSSLAYYA